MSWRGGAPDGRAWLFGPDSLVTVNPELYAGRNSFDAAHDLRVIASIGLLPSLLVVNPLLGPRTLAEFIAFAQAHRVFFASGGIGSADHLTMEYFADLAHLTLRHIAYHGGAPAIADVVSGQASSAFVVAGNAIGAVRWCELLPLAMSTAGQIAPLPDVPTVAESGFAGFDVATAYFVWLTARTPLEVAVGVGAQLRSALERSALQDRLRELGVVPFDLSPAQSMAWLDRERARWTDLIATHAIAPE